MGKISAARSQITQWVSDVSSRKEQIVNGTSIFLHLPFNLIQRAAVVCFFHSQSSIMQFVPWRFSYATPQHTFYVIIVVVAFFHAYFLMIISRFVRWSQSDNGATIGMIVVPAMARNIAKNTSTDPFVLEKLCARGARPLGHYYAFVSGFTSDCFDNNRLQHISMFFALLRAGPNWHRFRLVVFGPRCVQN